MKERITGKLRYFMEYLDDASVDVGDRLFLIFSVVALGGLGLAAIGGILIGENPASIAITLCGGFVFVAVISLGFRFRKMYLTKLLVTTIVIFVSLPLTFFTSGGVYGGTPLWCLFDTLFIGMILSGRTRIFFLIEEAFIVAGCWYAQYRYPQLVLEHDRDAIFSDSLGSLAIVSFVLLVLVTFQARLYKKENARVEAQKRQIEELNATQNRFFSSMSHEIRTPINTIIGLNEMILRENASEEINDDAENIKAASTMLLHLINDILDISKLESGQMQLDIRPYRTGEMLSMIVGMFWLRAKEKGIEFRIDIAPDIPAELMGDEVRIRQILINVINNAVKYTEKGSVTLTVQMEKNESGPAKIIYTVVDTGIGIRKDSIPFLFDAFSRVDGDENRYIEGTGLGLSIVKQFVDLMGGTVTVNSIYTKGSTFIVTIPQAIVDERPIEDIQVERRRNPARRNVYRQSFEAPEAKVLIVDDTEANLLVVEKLLRDTKVQMTAVTSGEEALKATLDTAFHVIFMDHMMPGMDGIECMHRIRLQTGGMSKDARIVALTANAQTSGSMLYEKEGFDGCLIKPIAADVLEHELMRLLPKPLVTLMGSDEEIIEETLVEKHFHRKKREVAITSESVADIPTEFIRRYEIGILPYRVTTETGNFKDAQDLQTAGTLAYLESGRKADSSPPSAEDYEKFFADSLVEAGTVIHIALSSKIERSGCEAAMEAARSFDSVFVFDSGQFSGGLALLVIEACRMAKERRDAAYILERLEVLKKRVRTSFVVDNVDYLVRQFSFSPQLARLAGAFLLRPLVCFKDGRMQLMGIRMGSWRNAERSYINKALTTGGAADGGLLFIVYAGLDMEELEWIAAQVKNKASFERIIFQCASPAIAVNCGPGAFGLMYME